MPDRLERQDIISIQAEAGHYVGFTSEYPSQLTVQYESDRYIDVLVLSEANLESYMAEQQFIARCADEAAISGSLACFLPAGQWYILFDNGGLYGAATPQGSVRVSYAYTVET